MNGRKPMGLYIHIPFCARKCAYCDFLSFPASPEQMKAYVQCLLTEIEGYESLSAEYEIQTIFIGGGTPSYLPKEYITQIMDALIRTFQLKPIHLQNSQIEVTIEANPGTLSLGKLKSYYQAGINRISIGLQTTDNEELGKLGRIHTYEMFLENYHMARKAGFENINVDLISSLPGQTPEDWCKTLNRVIALNPEHISAYSLIIEEGTPFYEQYHGSKGEQLLPSEETDRQIYQMTKKMLESAGYYRYEISNYARKGFESRHNNSYWIGTDYLGIGLGASSYIRHVRYHNETDLEEYQSLICQGNSIQREKEQLSKSQQIEEFMFLGLRRMEGVSIQEFQRRFGQDMEYYYRDVIEKLIMEQLIEREEDRICLTERGIDVSNQVFVEFLMDEME